jgi:chromosome segregation ATPase
MRYIVFLIVPFALGAQSAEPDSRMTQALINEMQQLRLAIERSTLLGARTQLAIGQLQLQDATVSHLAQQYNEARSSSASMNIRRNQLTEQIRELEQKRTSPEYTTPKTRTELDDQIQQMKFELEGSATLMQFQSAKEGELAAQLQAAQSQIAGTRSQIAEMERSLDAAIQQLLKPARERAAPKQ